MKLFLDTMIWLHYRAIEDTDINQILSNVADVTVVVPRITLRELDKHKNQHPNSKVRERARRMLHLIESIDGLAGSRLKNGIKLEAYQRVPSVDFENAGLDRGVADEYLIGTILTYMADNPQDAVRLYTEDSTPRLTAKPLGIDAQAYPAQLKLAAELDPRDKELRELKTEVARLKNLRPVLDCAFTLV